MMKLKETLDQATVDVPKEIIVTDARLQQLSHCQRKKRKYSKVDENYWTVDGKRPKSSS